METEPKQILCLPLEIEQSQLLYLPKETTNIISNIMELPKWLVDDWSIMQKNCSFDLAVFLCYNIELKSLHIRILISYK